ncbi:hypothetical protein [Saccharolobus islandicus]|nr:hypothetical protein [Sulfolobus islandicus]
MSEDNLTVIETIKSLIKQNKFEEALKLAKENNLDQQSINYIKALIYVQEALNDIRADRPREAINKLNLAQKLAPTLDLSYYLSIANLQELLDEAENELRNENYNTALQDLQQALQIAQQYNLTRMVEKISRQINRVNAYLQIENLMNEMKKAIRNFNFAEAYNLISQAVNIANQYDLYDQKLENMQKAFFYLAKIPPLPKPPQQQNLTLSILYNYINELYNYFTNAYNLAVEAVKYNDKISFLTDEFAKTANILEVVSSAMSLLLEAQKLAEQKNVDAMKTAITNIQNAIRQLQSINAENSVVESLYSAVVELAKKMNDEYAAYLYVLENLKKSNELIENGDFSEAVQLLQNAQQIAQRAGLQLNLVNYIQGFSILENLKPLPQPPKEADFSSLASYFSQLVDTLKSNYNTLQQASKYITINNLQNVSADIAVAELLANAMQDLANAQSLLEQKPEQVLQNKQQITQYITNAIQLLQQAQGTSSDLQQTAKQLFEEAQQYQDTVNVYLNGLQYAVNAMNAIDTVNKILAQKPNAQSPSQYFAQLANNYNTALKTIRDAIYLASNANQLFESIKLPPPFDLGELEKDQVEIAEFTHLFATASSAYADIENAESEKHDNSPGGLANYYRNIASAMANAISEIENVSTQQGDVEKTKEELLNNLKKQYYTFDALSHAYQIVANAQTNDPQTLYAVYNSASRYLRTASEQYNISQLAQLAGQFENVAQFYRNIAIAQTEVAQANNSQSINDKIAYLQSAINYLTRAEEYVPQESGEINKKKAQIEQAIKTLQTIQAYRQNVTSSLQSGNYASALAYYNELLKSTTHTNIDNVLNDIAQNNYFQAIQDIQNNPSLTPEQKQFLSGLVASIGINDYYIPLMNYALQNAHMQAQNFLQALSETVNFTQQMQPVLQNLGLALQYAQSAYQLSQYVPSPQVQNSLANITSQIQQQYYSVQEQVQKAQSNPVLNVLEGIVNTINTGLSNMFNFINNEIYSHLGRNVFTEVLAGIADGAIFVLISLIPVVGEAFDWATFTAFLGQTVFNLTAGSASAQEEINSLKQMFLNPANLSSLITTVVGLFIAHRLNIDDTIRAKLLGTLKDVKADVNAVSDSMAKNVDLKSVDTTLKDVTDFSKVNELVKQVDLKQLDIKALKGFKDKIVSIETEGYKFFKVDAQELSTRIEEFLSFKDVKIRLINAVKDVKIDINKSESGIELNVEPKLSDEVIATIEGNKVKLTTLSEESIKNALANNDLGAVLDTLKLNLASQIAKQLFDSLKTQDGNLIMLTNDEGLAFFNGKIYDVLYKDGKISSMQIIPDAEALAKLVKFAEGKVGSYITLNKSLIEQLIKDNNIQSLEYTLTNEIKGNAVRNEYLQIKDALGNVTKLTSKTEINPNEIKTTTTIQGKIPNISPNIQFLSPQDVDELLSFNNVFSNIFKQLVDAHPEVKDLLEKLASEGKLPNDLTSLEDIANKIKAFYDSLGGEIADIKNELSRYNSLFEDVNIDSIINNIIRKYVLNHASDVLNGETPKISISDILDNLSTADKAKVVLNYLKREDPNAYNSVLQKLSGLSQDAKDYVLASAYDELKIALENKLPLSGGVESIVNSINDTLEKIGVNQQINIQTNNNALNNGTQNTTNVPSNGQITITKPPENIQSAKTTENIITTLSNALQKIYPDFDKLNSTEKDLLLYILSRKLEEKGELTPEDIKNTIEEMKGEIDQLLENVKDYIDNVEKEKQPDETVLEYDKGIKELADKVSFDKLIYFTSLISNIANKFNVPTAIELLNQLNTLTPEELQNTIILTQPQIQLLSKIAPLLKDILVSLQKGITPKDLLGKIIQLRDLLGKMGVTIDVTTLVQLITSLNSIVSELNIKLDTLSALIATPVNGTLKVIPITFQSVLNISPSISTNNVQVPENEINISNVNTTPQIIQQLQELLNLPNLPPPPGSGGETEQQNNNSTSIPPSINNQQSAEYVSRRQYLIL